MHLAFVRHGEPRRGEADPALTSWGHRCAQEAGTWLVNQGVRPSVLLHTPTVRTRETAEAVAQAYAAAALPCAPPAATAADLPSDAAAWHRLVARFEAELAGDAGVILVGHHPTQGLLSALYNAGATPIPPSHRAAVILVHTPALGAPWTLAGTWRGRPS